MIRQNGNGNNRRTGRSKEYAQYIPAALAVGSYLLDQGPRQSGTSTSTQQNLPSWATPFAQNTLDMGRYFTNNPNYRPRTLDQDYSGDLIQPIGQGQFQNIWQFATGFRFP